MSVELFDKQMQDVKRLTSQIEAHLSQAEQQTADWLTTVEQIGNQVQPILNVLLENVESDTGRLRQLQSSCHLVSDLLNRMAIFAARATFHSQVIHFRLRILGIKMQLVIQYWFYRLLPYTVALVLLILIIVFWEEIVFFLGELLAAPPVP